jgi:hypothetical protein
MFASNFGSATSFGAGFRSSKTRVFTPPVFVILNVRPSTEPWNDTPFLLVRDTLFMPWKSAPYSVVSVMRPDDVEARWYFRTDISPLLTVVLLWDIFVAESKINCRLTVIPSLLWDTSRMSIVPDSRLPHKRATPVPGMGCCVAGTRAADTPPIFLVSWSNQLVIIILLLVLSSVG